MDRNFRKVAGVAGAGASPPSEAWLFAQALLGKPVPSASRAAADARANREHLEWLASISPEHERRLHCQLSEEADARAQREQLEWLATISPRHESQLRRLLASEAEAAEAQERAQWLAEGSQLQEAQWNAAKHPRGAFPQNRGWWSPTGGAGGSSDAARSSSFFDAVIRRNQAVADLTGGTTPGMARSSRLAADLESAARLPGEVASAAAAGLGTGGKALVNASATAIKNVATLGLSASQLELLGVTKEDRARGYDTAVTIATASGEVLIAVGTGGIASALSKGGSIAKTASGALIAFDAAGNAVGVVQGAYDVSQNGVNLSNGAQVAAGVLGLGANLKATQTLTPPPPTKEVTPGRGGRYGHLEDPPAANTGKDFTSTQKKVVIAENQRQNGGVLRDDRTGEVLVPGQQRGRGVPAPPNEAQVDHVYPKSKGGPNTYSNAEVRSRLNNVRKGKKLE
jgi:DNA-directed RNA polymerase subunit F